MFIECPICPVIVEKSKNYVLNLKYFTKPEFFSKNYHKHFFWSPFYIWDYPPFLTILGGG